MSDPVYPFGERVAAQRLRDGLRRIQAQRGWSGREMARALGVSEPTYSRIYNGGRLPDMGSFSTRCLLLFPELAREVKP
jgi:transcriptional regulator with XRE-family HTH domain